MSIEDTRKLARRLAMTGGYEVRLRPGMEEGELALLCALWVPELKSFPEDNSERRSSLVYRILRSVLNEDALTADWRERLEVAIGTQVAANA